MLFSLKFSLLYSFSENSPNGRVLTLGELMIALGKLPSFLRNAFKSLMLNMGCYFYSTCGSFLIFSAPILILCE